LPKLRLMRKQGRQGFYKVPAMPLAGEPSGQWRARAPRIALALLAVLAVVTALPRVAHASPGAYAAGTQDGCANATVSAASAPAQTMRNAVLCLVNYERSTFQLPALRQVPKLTNSAQRYTTMMVRDHFFSHRAPNGSTPGTRILASGFHWTWAGENIASGYTTPLSVVTAWMRSQGHCYNLLAPTFSDVGVGVSPNSVAGTPGLATWTQDFGLPAGQRAPSGNWNPANTCPH
jgi:uncharacterized protein YkwD